MGVNVARFGRTGGFNHVARRTPPGSFGLRRVAVFDVFADGASCSESLVFPMAGKTEIVIMIRLQKL